MMKIKHLKGLALLSGMLGLGVSSSKAQSQVRLVTDLAATNIAKVQVQSHGANFFTEPSDFDTNSFVATTNGVSLLPGIGGGITNTPTAEGQLLISSNGVWQHNLLTAGSGILITNNAGNIEISVSAAAGGNVPLAGDVIMTGGLTNEINLSVVRTGAPTIGLNINQSATESAILNFVGDDGLISIDGTPRVNFNQGSFGEVTFGSAGAELFIAGELGFNNNDVIYFGATGTSISGNSIANTLTFLPGAGEIGLSLDNGGLSFLGSHVPVASPLARIFGVEGALGTDIVGGNLTIRAGQSTGSGSGGIITLQVSPLGGSGASLNSYVNALVIAQDGTVTLLNALGETSGGTGTATYTTGDILYADGANSLSKLAIGTTGYLLTVTNGVVAWLPSPASGGGEANSASNQGAGTVAWFAGKSGIDLTYNSFSSGNSLLTLASNASVITATINEALIDHNNLVNYTVNRHYPRDDASFSSTTLLSGEGVSNHVEAVVAAVDMTDLNDFDSGSFISGAIPIGTSGGEFQLSVINAGPGIIINNSSGAIQISTISGSPASTLLDDLIDGWLLSESSGLNRISLLNNSDNILTNHSGNVLLSAEGFASFFAGTTTDEILSTANTSRIPLTTNWTMFTRFKALTVGSGSQQYVVIDESRSGVATDSKFRLSYNTSVQPTIRIYDDAGASVTAVWGLGLSTGVWYNVLTEYNASNRTIALNINNSAPITSSSLGGDFNVTTSTNSALGIGGLDGAAAGALPNARIDTTYFWERFLTTAEKSELHNSGQRTVIQLPIEEGEANDGTNIGGGVDIVAGKNGLSIEHKTLVAGAGVTITPTSTDITIAASAVGIIDDVTPATNSTYSSTKIEADFAESGSNTDITSMSGLGLEPFALASVTAPGSILISTNASSFPFVQFPVGSDGQVLTADSSSSNGVVWATSSGGGGGGSGFLQINGLNEMDDDALIAWGPGDRSVYIRGDSSGEDLQIGLLSTDLFDYSFAGFKFLNITADDIQFQSASDKITFGSHIMSFHINNTNQFAITTNLITVSHNLNVLNDLVASTLESSVSTGIAPLIIASTTLVPNLNADLLDGNEASAFTQSITEDVESGSLDIDVGSKTITGISITPPAGTYFYSAIAYIKDNSGASTTAQCSLSLVRDVSTIKTVLGPVVGGIATGDGGVIPMSGAVIADGIQVFTLKISCNLASDFFTRGTSSLTMMRAGN